MDAKEVGTLLRALTKASQNNEPASNILDILKKLKDGVVPTEELLRLTKVGVMVNRQKQHPDKEVAQMASEIVTRWKDEVHKNKPASAKKGNGSGKKSKSKTPEARITVPLNERTWKKDNVDPKRTGDDLRNNGIGLMYDGLACGAEESPTLVLKRAIDIEYSIFARYGCETTSDYKAKLRSLYQNLKSKSNPKLRVRVLSGEIPANRLVVMNYEELKSAERRAEDEKLQKENMDKAMVAQVEKSVSSALVCGKCGQKKVSYSQAQTRSADEPMTTFCECQVCGHRWKFS